MSSLAETLYANKEYRKLELHFSSTLKNSTNISLFKLYFKYVQTTKDVDIIHVYSFILKKLQHHWDIFPIATSYINHIQQSMSSDEDKIVKIRSIYHTLFLTPMSNFKLLWQMYESFEMDLNKTTASKIIAEMLPIYQKTYRLYLVYKNAYEYDGEDVHKLFTVDDFYVIMDIENRNVAGFSEEHFNARLGFIYAYFCERFTREDIYFHWSEFIIKNGNNEEACKLIQRGIDIIDDSMFLKFYYANISGINIYDDLLAQTIAPSDKISTQNNNVDLILINLMTHELKAGGLERFRSQFKKYLTQEIGPNVFIFVAVTEYFYNNDKSIPFKIYTKALQKYPNDTTLQEYFLKFLLEIGDMVNARAYLENFVKTEKLINMMRYYEARYGNLSDFRNLLEYKIVEQKNDVDDLNMTSKELYYVQFKKSFEFNELKFGNCDLLSNYLEVVNSIRDIKFINFDKQIIIEILENIKTEE